MSTLAFNYEEIVPRELKPALFELDRFESDALEAKAEHLRRLVVEYVPSSTVSP